MSTLVQTAAELARPWADLYGSSAAVASAVAFLHFGGLMAAGGTALAADRARTYGFDVVPLSGPTRAQLPARTGHEERDLDAGVVLQPGDELVLGCGNEAKKVPSVSTSIAARWSSAHAITRR